MKIDLKEIVDGIEFQTDESQSFLNKLTGEVLSITDEEMCLAESEDISDQPEWLQDVIVIVKKYIKEQENYLELPTKYDFHEYHVMEKFILSLPNEGQREELYYSIKGRGAFSNFKRGLNRFLLEDEWYQYRDKALMKLAEDWCVVNGIELK